MNNQRPLSNRKVVQLMLALTILAWATQTLFHQWGYGQEPTPDGITVPDTVFIKPLRGMGLPHGTLVLRSDAVASEGTIRLKTICRWSDADAPAFKPLADLSIAKCSATQAYTPVTIEQLRGVMHDAGFNPAVISFAGATTCVVKRSNVQDSQEAQLQSWIDARKPQSSNVDASAARVAKDHGGALAVEPPAALPKSLKQLLTEDLATRTELAADALQVQFAVSSSSVLNLAEPYFHFTIEPQRMHSLGDESWDVLISAQETSQKVHITGTARAWQTQVLLVRPLAYRETITAEDVAEKRALIDSLSDDPVLSMSQVVGQQAARDLKPGMLMTARLVDPAMLAQPGQLITVVATSGAVRITTVAKALEAGARGQTIRCRTESEPSVSYDVRLTGPQEGTISGMPAPAQLAVAAN